MAKVDIFHDYYRDLEVMPTASPEEIKKQFKFLALKFHPVRNPGKEVEVPARFHAIQVAHEILVDPLQRAKYDNARTERGLYEDPVVIGAKDGEGKMKSRLAAKLRNDVEEWHLAVRRGHEMEVRRLLENGVDIETQDYYGRTALYWAVKSGHESIARILLSKGADVEAKDNDCMTALHWAVQCGYIATVQLLIESGADIEARDFEGKTALHWAARYKDRRITQLLLDKGVNIDIKDFEGNTALHWAARHGDEIITQLLLEKGVNIEAKDFEGRTALHWAARYGNETLTQLLLDKGINIDTKDLEGRTALHWAAKRGNKTITQLLLEKKTTTQLLLERGVNIGAKDDKDRTALRYAEEFGYPKMMTQRLLEKAAEGQAKDNKGRRELNLEGDNPHRVIEPDVFQSIYKEMQRGIETSKPRNVIFQIHWDLLGYCKEELDESPVLAPLLTVTGSTKTAYATTCVEYMNRYWPRSGTNTLGTLQAALSQEVYETHWSSGLRFSVDLSAWHKGLPDTHATIEICGSQEYIIEIAQQLAWLCAVFRVPKYDKVTLSDIVFEKIDDRNFQLSLLDLQPVSEKELSCWHPLFMNGVIARGFPIPSRQEEVGIELPFEVMIALSRVLYPLEYYDGIILKGHSTVLIPTARYSDSVQWHFISSSTPEERLTTDSIKNHITDWFETCDFDLLRRARTFLGYCKNAEIHLGTQGLDYTSIKRSDAQSERSRLEISGKISASVGSSGQGFFGAMFGSEIVYPKSLRAITNSTELFLDDRLLRAREQPLLLYDTEKKRGWLVPELSVILHIAHVWASRQLDLSPNIIHDIPHAVISPDGGMAAWDAIMKGKLLKVRPEGVEGKPQLFIDVIKSFLTALESRKEEIIKREDSSNSRPFRQPGLRGWDLLDIVTWKHIFGRKEVPIMKSTGKWDLVASENPEVIVLFGEGLGEPIKPERHEKLCRTWTPVPEGRYYLTASVRCLKQVAAVHGGSKLTPRLHWHRPPKSKLFEACEFGVGHGCDRLQSLKEKSFTPPGLLEPNGAVIFGKMGKEGGSCCELLNRQLDAEADMSAQNYLLRKNPSLIGCPADLDQAAVSSCPMPIRRPMGNLHTKQATRERKHNGGGKAVSKEYSGYNGTKAVPLSSGEANDITPNEQLSFPCSNGEGPSSVQAERFKGGLNDNEVHHKDGQEPTYPAITPVTETSDISSSRKEGKKPAYLMKEPLSETLATTSISRIDGKGPEYLMEEYTTENDDTSRTSHTNGNTLYSHAIAGNNYHSTDLEANVVRRRRGLESLTPL